MLFIAINTSYASDAILQYKYHDESYTCDAEYIDFYSRNNTYEVGELSNCQRADKLSLKCPDDTESAKCAHYEPPEYSISNGDNPVALGIVNYHPAIFETITYITEMAVMINVENQTKLIINVRD